MSIAEPVMLPLPRDRDEDGNLDDTSVMRRQVSEIAAAVSKKPAVPPWLLPLVIYLVGQLVGSVWWAATMQSDVRYLQSENMKLWQKVETHDLQLQRLDKIVRDAVKEAMSDANYVRIREKGEQ